MTQDELRSHARREPFVPFRLTLADGKTVPIWHRHHVMLGKTSAVLGIAHWPGSETLDTSMQVDLDRIISAEIMAGPEKLTA